MRETDLHAFFTGQSDAETLARASEGFLVTDGSTQTGRPICDLPTESPLRLADLVMLCDAVISGELPPTALCPIGFFLIACDNFTWDTSTPEGDQISETLFEWAAPEINYPLTIENVQRWRARLGSP